MSFKRRSQLFTFPSTQTFCKVNKSCNKYQAWNRNEKYIFWLGGETRQKKNIPLASVDSIISVFLVPSVFRSWLWAGVSGTRPTWGAVGTFWTGCWCWFRSLTFWCRSSLTPAPRSWACSESWGCCGRWGHCGKCPPWRRPNAENIWCYTWWKENIRKFAINKGKQRYFWVYLSGRLSCELHTSVIVSVYTSSLSCLFERK